jgi:S1-C subfamily serine protease
VRLDRDGGLVPGDVILAIDGETVDSVSRLLSVLDEYRIGDTVTLRVWRSGRERQISASLQGD